MSNATLVPPADTSAKVKFSHTICPAVPTISALASSLELLQDEFRAEDDLDVTIKLIGFSGKLEYPYEDRLWIRNAGHAPAIWARSHGVDNKVLALSWLEGHYPVVALGSSSIRTVADLKGKRIGVIRTQGTPFDLSRASQLKVYSATLQTAGLTLDDVTLVDIEREPHKPGAGNGAVKDFLSKNRRDLTDRLIRGDFDAVTVGIASQEAAGVGLRVIYDTRNHPDPLQRVNPGVLRGVVASGAIIRERSDLVARDLARLLQAADWAKAHPDEVGAKLAAGYGIPVGSLVPNYVDLSEGVQIDLSKEKIEALRVQKDFLLKHKFIPRDFDVEPWVDHAPLEEARRLYASWKNSGKAA